MKITHKIAAGLVVLLLALLAGAAVILNGAVRPGFERLERAAHQRDLARVGANLAAIADDMRSRVTDYAYWDDTYEFLADHNRAFTDDLTDAWLVDYGVDIVVFADRDGDVIWHRVLGLEGEARDDLRTANHLAAFVAAGVSGRAARSGVVWLPDFGFVTVSFAQSTRSDGGGRPRGWVIFGKRLTNAALSHQTQMRIELVGAGAGSDLSSRIRTLDRAPTQTWTSSRAIYALSALRDPFGALVGAVYTQQPRETMALAGQSINVAVVLFAGALVLALAALWALLHTLVVRRVERLEAHLRAQKGEPLPLTGKPALGADEISRLTDAYNALVERLGEVGAREQAAVIEKEALAKANRMKSDFLANVSHELRRPLDAIIGYAELISEELGSVDAAHTRTDLARISDSARRLLTLIGEILDISRIDAGRLQLRPETFRIEEMLEAMRQGPCADANLRTRATGDLGTAYTDRRRLTQSLVNAVQAARQLAPDGRILLSAARFGQTLRFEIQAQGAKLDAENAAPSDSPLMAGEALGHGGLAIAVTHKLMRLLGGALEVNSGPQGVSFVLTATATLQDHVVSAEAA